MVEYKIAQRKAVIELKKGKKISLNKKNCQRILRPIQKVVMPMLGHSLRLRIVLVR